MNILEAIILGIVQGITEFLPVSSSGHLLLFKTILGIENNSIAFDLLLHIATLIPVCIIFKKQIISLIKNPFQKLTYLLIVATIPAAIAGLLFEDYLDVIFENSFFIAITFIITGVLLLYCDNLSSNNYNKKQMTYFDALFIGLIQAIAILPGISRSGSTITASMSRKLNKDKAATFSFLMSIPVILGGFLVEILKMISNPVQADIQFLPAVFGFVFAFIAGYISIKFMLELIKKSKLYYFSYYLFSLSFLILLDYIFFNLFFS